MDIQWYPGHMTKARRQMQEDLKLIDLVIELTDARAPQSSRNPDIDALSANKSRIIILNKADLADEHESRAWAEYYKSKGFSCIIADSRKASALKSLPQMVTEACSEKIARDARRGIKNRPIRAMVAGIPNCGKSTFINSYAGRAAAKTGNKPGVTKGKQWIKLGKGLELLDTPGILWPKFDDPQVGVNLAMLGYINDQIINIEELSINVIEFMTENYPGRIAERFGIDESLRPAEILYEIGRKRGCLTKGSEVSYEKAAAILMDEFRSGKLGRITLEKAQ